MGLKISMGTLKLRAEGEKRRKGGRKVQKEVSRAELERVGGGI